MKTKVLFWGGGKSLAYVVNFFQRDLIQIVGVVDKEKSVETKPYGELYMPQNINELEFDYLVISSIDYADDIYRDAINCHIPHEKIIMPTMTRGQMIKVWNLLTERGIQQINFLKSDEMSRRLIRIEQKVDGMGKRVEAINQKQRKNFKAKNLQYLRDYYEEKAAKFIIENFIQGESAPGRNVIFDSRITYREYMADILKNKDGLFLEFGVFEGKSINHMSELLPHKKFYGFDSFEGLPETWFMGYEKGRFDLNGNMPTCNENVSLIKGWFNDTLPLFLQERKENVAWIHMDCDIYSSSKYVLNMLSDKIVSGTIVMFDELVGPIGYEMDELKAFKEFVEENGYNFRYVACSSVWDEHGIYVAVAIEIL